MARSDLDRLAAMESQVREADQSYRAAALEAEIAADPHGTTVVEA